MVGKDSDGNEILIIESKFWAGLTDNQPVKYIERMPKDQKTAIVFLAPKLRFPTLWHELLRRAKEAKLTPKEKDSNIADLKICKLCDNNVMALASWQSVLGYMHRACEADNQLDLVSDISQLMGLCDSQDQDAFLPLRSEELSSHTAKRISDFCSIINHLKIKLVNDGIGNTKGLRTTSNAGNYSFNTRIKKYNCGVAFDIDFWQMYCETPFWLYFFDHKWGFDYSKKFLSDFDKLLIANPPLGFHTNNYAPTIPLFPLLGKEIDDVVDNIVEQIKHIFNEYLL